MEYITAAPHMADAVYDVLHTTIKTIYPYYYPAEVADFFCRHHSREHILEGIASGNMGVLMENDMVVGTGCYDGNHITGVYVLPCCQNRGYKTVGHGIYELENGVKLVYEIMEKKVKS